MEIGYSLYLILNCRLFCHITMQYYYPVDDSNTKIIYKSHYPFLIEKQMLLMVLFLMEAKCSVCD